MKSPKWLGDSLNFQFNKILFVFLDKSISSFGTKTSRPAGHQVVGTGSKSFASGSLGVIVAPLPFLDLTTGAVNPGCWRNSTIHGC